MTSRRCWQRQRNNVVSKRLIDGQVANPAAFLRVLGEAAQFSLSKFHVMMVDRRSEDDYANIDCGRRAQSVRR